MERDDSYLEKRRFGRLEARQAIQYRKVSGTPSLPEGSVSFDISGGGVRVLSQEFMPVSTKVAVSIPIEHTNKTVNTVARVAWVQKKAYSEQYDVGLEFVDINAMDRRDILNYVDRNLAITNAF